MGTKVTYGRVAETGVSMMICDDLSGHDDDDDDDDDSDDDDDNDNPLDKGWRADCCSIVSNCVPQFA